jgi:hypothetical protein
MREACDGLEFTVSMRPDKCITSLVDLISVVHGHSHTFALEVVDIHGRLLTAICGCVDELQFPRSRCDKVR